MMKSPSSDERQHRDLDESLLGARRTAVHKQRFSWKDIALIVLGTVALLSTSIALQPRRAPENLTSSYTGISASADRWVQYQWWTKYSRGASQEDVDAEWSSITPAHGIVALDKTWAAEHNLPATMRLPSDHSKGVYIIDAYHQLHCLTIVRRTFFELAAGRTPTVPPAHSTHCFDSLRQYVMCTAADTPLYTWGKNETGDGQLRKCRDWKALQQWAADHTACYADSERPVQLGEHFGHCDGHGDGLEPPF